MEPETETQEWETEEVTVIMEERIDEPRPMPVKEAEKNKKEISSETYYEED